MTLDDLKPLKLLVAVDGSMGSVKAVQKAAELAKDAVAHEVVIIHVMEMREFPSLISDAYDESKEARAKAVLDDMTEVANSAGIEVKAVLLKGHPVQSVLDYADIFKPNMILVGSRGMNPAKNVILGSVSSAISKKAKCPVLIVRSD
ncbi:MAG: universal stress protein [Methanomassiliicoccales archaeon]|nr:MAG: universal stress protein [Methanomassiliicoccales archaeon]